MENVLLQSIILCFPKDIQEPSSEKVHQSFPYLKEVSKGLFGEKAILEAKFVLESDKSNDANDDYKSLNDEAQKLTNFVQSTPDEYCPLSPASSDHSVYQPPALTNQSYSEDSKTNLGKVVSYF